VFYHIVDDHRFANAVRCVGALTEGSGVVLAMDQLHSGRYQISKHVVYRDTEVYVDLFDRAGLKLVDNELLFHYLVPPVSGYRVIDFTVAGFFKLAGLILQVSDGLADWTATRLRGFDSKLRLTGRQVSNSEMFVFRKFENRP
jgi:hypothetical protein